MPAPSMAMRWLRSIHESIWCDLCDVRSDDFPRYFVIAKWLFLPSLLHVWSVMTRCLDTETYSTSLICRVSISLTHPIVMYIRHWYMHLSTFNVYSLNWDMTIYTHLYINDNIPKILSDLGTPEFSNHFTCVFWIFYTLLGKLWLCRLICKWFSNPIVKI